MKKLLSLLLLSGALLACNDTDGDGNKDINIHIDVDSTGEKIKDKMDELADSTAAKTRRLGNTIDEKLDSSRR